MNFQKITPLSGTPLNGLFLAINHYVSTGDHIGEGIAAAMQSSKATGEPLPHEQVQILIPVNKQNPPDLEDFEKFRAKVASLSGQPIQLQLVDRGSEFDLYLFALQYCDAAHIAMCLTASPGPLGWGSTKALVDKAKGM